MKINKAIINSVNNIWSSKNFFSDMLLPWACITQLVVNNKIKKYEKNPAWHPNIPVIVVGNIYVGGTGKTPVVIELVKHLQKNGFNPAVISRGYGVKNKTDPIVGIHPLDPDIFGDEPALIAKETGVIVAVHPKRVLAATALIEENNRIRNKTSKLNNSVIDVIVLDDGLQHLSIGRDIEIIVQDARGIGNGRLLPAGPLREPASRLNTVDIIINNQVEKPINTDLDTSLAVQNQADPDNNRDRYDLLKLPIHNYMQLYADTVTHLNSNKTVAWHEWIQGNANKNISVLAGIGNPARFFDMLKLDLKNINDLYPLPDHARIDQNTFNKVVNDIVLITNKDAIKCKHIHDDRIWVVNAIAKFNNDLWLQYILDKLNNWKSNAIKTN